VLFCACLGASAYDKGFEPYYQPDRHYHLEVNMIEEIKKLNDTLLDINKALDRMIEVQKSTAKELGNIREELIKVGEAQ